MLSEKHPNALSRGEIVRGKSTISRLFNQGARLKGGSLLMIHYSASKPVDQVGRTSVKVLFTVGKKLVPRAVDRNRIKRLMREAYRLEKGALSLLFASEDGRKEDTLMLLTFLYRGRTDSVQSLSGFRGEIRQMLKNFVLKRLPQVREGDQGV
jgi:ribonuclease P protein component